jgi:hypothetical protein
MRPAKQRRTTLRSGAFMPSRNGSSAGEVFHGQISFETCSFMLAPVKAETGIKVTSLGLKMPFLRKVESCVFMKSKLGTEKEGTSARRRRQAGRAVGWRTAPCPS